MIVLLALAIGQVEPTQSPGLYDRAVAERRSGHPSQAVTLLEVLLRAEPDNSDGWVQLGFARRDAGDRAGALEAFQKALELAPDYQDAKDGIVSLKRAPSSSPSVSLDVSRTAVRYGADWTEVRLGTSVPLSPDAAVGLAVEQSHRFGRDDTYVEGRLDSRLNRQLSYYLALGATPAADYRPVWQAKAGVTTRLSEGANPWFATLDAGAAKYTSGSVWTLTPGIQKYLAGGKAWVSGQWINLVSDGRHFSGGLGRMDVMASDNVRLFAGFAHAPDLSEGRAIQTTSMFGGAVVAVNGGLKWRSSIARDKPSTGLTRTTFSTGLDLQFR